MDHSEERDLKDISKRFCINTSGEATLQMIVPLIILFFILISIAYIMPVLSPIKVLALVGGMVVFFISFVSTEIGLYILIFSMLLSPEFIVGTTAGGTLGRGITLRLDDFLLVLIGLSWVARMSVKKELGLFLRTPLNKPIAYYLLACLVSTLIGALFGRVNLKTGFFFVLKYFEYMIVYFMVANYLDDKRKMKKYLGALLITCAIVTLVGIAQIPFGGRITAPFEGEAGEPNTLGGYLVFMIALVTGLLLTTTSSRKILTYLFLIFLFLIPLLFTQSRSSYGALVGVVFILIWLSEKKKWLILGIILVGIAMPIIGPSVVKERIAFTFLQGQRQRDVVEVGGIKLDTSTSARLLSYRQASLDWIKHPILGFGVTGYRFIDAQYLKVLMDTGILGLVMFFFLMRSVFKEGYRIYKERVDPFEKGLSMGFLAGFIGLLFHAVGGNTFIIVRIMEPFWFVAAMVILMPQLDEVKEKSLPTLGQAS